MFDLTPHLCGSFPSQWRRWCQAPVQLARRWPRRVPLHFLSPRAAVQENRHAGIRFGRTNAAFEIARVGVAEQLGLIYKKDELQGRQRSLVVAAGLRGVE